MTNDHELHRIADTNALTQQHVPLKRKPPATDQRFSDAFHHHLTQTQSEVTFSNHAQQRLEKRNIDFTQEHQERLNQAVDRLSQKGAKEALVLMEDMALVVGISQKTVITAMDQQSMQGNIITNIDSAIIT